MNYSNFNDNNYQEKEQDSNIFFQGNPKDKKNYKVSKTIQMILIILTFVLIIPYILLWSGILNLNPKIVPEVILLDQTEIGLKVGDTKQLNSSVLPPDASNRHVIWSSSDPSIVSVNEVTGYIKGLKEGNAVVTVKTTYNNIINECYVTVSNDDIFLSKISLNEDNIPLAIGYEHTLTYQLYPKNTTNNNLTFTSSDPSVANVNSKGIIKAIKEGSAIITVSSNNGKISDSLIVSVFKEGGSIVIDGEINDTKYPDTITLNHKKLTLNPNTTTQLIATINPNDASKDISWSSTNPNIASVDSNGLINANSIGSTKIVAKTINGKIASVEVEVVKQKIDLSSIKINNINTTLNILDTKQLQITFSPTNATDKTITWSSSNSNIVSVDNNGFIKALQEGNATITAKSKNGLIDKINIKVIDNLDKEIKPTDISLNQDTYSIYTNQSITLTPSIIPSNATNKNIIFTSSDTSIATVDSNGIVKGIKSGKAIITLKIKNTNITKTVSVNVKNVEAKKITLNTNLVKLTLGSSQQLFAQIEPENAYNKTIIWSSSNTNVATVDSNGFIKANNEGSAIITATIKGTNIKETAKVEVSKKQEPSITLNKYFLNMEIGSSEKIIATIQNSTNKTIIWSSSNTNVATVDSNGNVKALSPGTTVITAKIKDTNVIKEAKVTVNEIKVTDITLNTTNIDIKINGSYQLSANVLPENATNKELEWSSSNTNVATVDSNGYVKAINIGNAVIKAKVKNTNIEKSVTVNVSKIEVTNIKLNKTSTTLQVGKDEQLISTIEPSNATNKNITWSSSNQSVAIVDSTGKIHGLNKGTAIITAYLDGKSATCEVTVNNITFTWNNGVETLITSSPGAPRVYTLNNGSLIAGYEIAGANGKLQIKTAISRDGGNTWTNTTIASFKENRNCANINFFIDGNNLYMAYRAIGENATSLQVSVSYDQGITWQHHSTVLEYTGSTSRGVWEPYLGILNGKLTCFYANDSTKVVSSSSYQNIEYLVWNGSSWTNRTIVSNGKNHNSRDGMPVWTRLSTGEYVIIIESSKYRNSYHPFVIQLLYSDDGINWSNPVDVYIPTSKNSKAAAPGIIEIPSTNQLVISFQTDEDATKKGDSYSVMKTIYSTVSFKELKENIKSGNSITNKFSSSENIFKTPNGASTVWTGIHYKNGWLYATAGGSSSTKSGSLLKKIYIG